jgi:Protein of unknown function (DUF3105)
MAAKGKTTPSKNAGRTPARGNRPVMRRPMPPPVSVSRPKPWGLIIGVVAVVVFAAGVIGYAVLQVQNKNNAAKANAPDTLAAAAAKIPGVTVKTNLTRNHQSTPVTYAESPPIGGNHDPEWADCSGTVYASPIRKENAVHSLEHGAVWITYRPGLAADQVNALKQRVQGVDYMLMSPYPGLKTAVSLQSWGHQLFVDSASDPRIGQFITDLKHNTVTTPEPTASCVNPSFKSNPRAPDKA